MEEQNESDKLKIINSTDKTYEVERIVKKGIGEDGKTYYQIKWTGYTEDQNTWEPAETLTSIKELVQEYELELIKRSKKSSLLLPEQINYIKFYNKKIYLNITWNKNKDGSCNPDSMVSYDEIRSTDPLLLINYYERQFKYGKNNLKLTDEDTINNEEVN